MRIKRAAVLRSMECAGIALGFVPLLAALTALFGHPVLTNLPRIPWMVLCGLGGFYLRRCLCSHTPFLRGTLLFCGCCAAGAGAFFPFMGAELPESVFLALIFGVACWWCSRYWQREFSQIITKAAYFKLLGVYGAFLFFSPLAGNWIATDYSIWLNAACFILITILYVPSHNQGNIDALTTNRRYSLSNLPQKIRVYNLALVAGILLAILLLFLLFIPCISSVEDWLGRLWQQLVDRFSRSAPYLQEESQQGITAPGMMPSGIPEGLLSETDEIPWLGTLFQVLFTLLGAGGVLAVLIYNLNPIANGLRRLWGQLLLFFSNLFRRSRPAQRREETSDYTDINQSIAVGEGLDDEPDTRSRQRQWQKDYRRYQKMPDSAEKFRRGYGLTVAGLTLAGAGISPSDTPLEIAGKAEALFAESGCLEASCVYNLLRYGEAPYQAGQEKLLDRTLQEIGRLTSKRKSGRK